MGTTIRLSASGPDIANDDGGDFTPGTGARLRLAEAQTTVGSTTNVITTLDQVIAQQIGVVPVSPMVASLAAPSAKKNYRATLCCDAMSDLTNANITLTMSIQTSPDGTTWATKVANQHWLGFAAGDTGADNARHCRLDLILQSGTALGVFDGDASLQVRGLIRADKAGATVAHPSGSGDETGVGSCYVALEELF